MNKRQIKRLIKLLNKAITLKEVKRTGWVLKGIKGAESVADHTWLMSLLIVLLAPDSLDKEKLLKMNAIHDLGEIAIGDTKWEKGQEILSPQSVKRRAEMKIVKKMFKNYPNGKEYIELLQEFNKNKTPEAKFLKQIDKMEMAIQALKYEQEGYSSHLFDEFWENTEKYLKGQSLEPVFREFEKMRKKLPS